MKKELPVGIEDYLDAQNYYYVDKTMLINDIVTSMLGKSILVTRPRRFGKTLVVSMLERFFDIQEDNKKYFLDKAIASCDEAFSYLNSRPVIHISMKDVTGRSKEEIIKKCIDKISELYQHYLFIARSDSLSIRDKEYFLSIANQTYDKEYLYIDSIRRLSYYLNLHYQKKAIILIDEYDTPIESSFENGVFEESMAFFKELYSSALKGNENVLFCFVTGVLEIAKESLFSGLNNLSVYSVIDDKLNTYFGFTEQETRLLLEEYEMGDKLEELRQWYGGYEFGNATLFNPWSLLNYVEKKQIRTYWVITGSNSLISKLLSTHAKNDFLDIINNDNSLIRFNNAINYKDFEIDQNAIYSYLVQAGYLVAVYKSAPSYFSVKIPNKEAYDAFKNDVIARGFNPSMLSIASKLKDAVEKGEKDTISSIIENYIVESFSYYDLKNEKSYQVLLTGILAVLFDTHVVKTEVNGTKGRCDIMISPKKTGEIGIIFEVKYHQSKSPISKAKLKESASSAIRQIEKHRYYGELLRRECSKILLYGIAFDQNGTHALDIKAVK